MSRLLSKRYQAYEKKSKKLDIGINIGLVLLLLFGLILIFNDPIKNWFISLQADNGIAHLTLDKINQAKGEDADFDANKVRPASMGQALRAMFNHNKLAIGGIAIPDLNIKLGIFKGVSNDNLLIGAGTLDPHQKMGQGNYVLASHYVTNPNLLFSPLHRAKNGQKIYITDLKKVYTYEINFVKQVAPTETKYLDQVDGKAIITLITCGELDGKTRIIVRGNLIGQRDFDDSDQSLKQAFGLK